MKTLMALCMAAALPAAAQDAAVGGTAPGGPGSAAWQRFFGPGGRGSAEWTGQGWKTDSGRAWYVDRSGTTARGGWSARTDGQSTKTAGGATWQSLTTGASDSGRSWTVDRSGNKVRNGDGTAVLSRDATKTFDDGRTVTRHAETTVTRTTDGLAWSTEGTQTGPRGTSTLAGQGTLTRTADGAVWDVSRSGTTPGGRTWTSTTQGAGQAAGGGRQWQSATQGTAPGGATWKTTRNGQAAADPATGTVRFEGSRQTTGGRAAPRKPARRGTGRRR